MLTSPAGILCRRRGCRPGSVPRARRKPSDTPERTPSSSLLRFVLIFFSLIGLFSCGAQQAYFCPDEGCAQVVIDQFDAASSTLHVAIAYFTHEGIAKSLIEAKERGIDVKVVGDAWANDPSNPEAQNIEIVRELQLNGVPYRDDGNDAGTMHDKFAVIDGQVVLTGSFNYTDSADTRNNENLVVLYSKGMAAAFEDEFEKLWEIGRE